MTSPLRHLLRLTVLFRPALLALLVLFYLSPLVTHGWRTSWQRGPLAAQAEADREAALLRAGHAAHAAPVYFQTVLFAPLKWLGSDRCYVELTQAQVRTIENGIAR